MLEVDNVFKDYGGKPLLKGVSFSVSAGETVCLLGPSGSGKSTLLRIIAGLEAADSGQVRWDSLDLSVLPVHRRNFGLMFQDYALFPHRSVAENTAFGLRMQNLPRAEIDGRVRAALEQVGMAEFVRRRVTDLSGGEQQRVALARALAPRPRLLMLDEPLGALDRRLREQLLDELHHLLHTTHIPAIYVTHDQEEAFTLADRLVVLHEGRVAQAGSPAEVYGSPASAWVAGFFGLTNQAAGRVRAVEPLVVETALGVFLARTAGPGLPNLGTGDGVQVLFRPEGARILPAEDAQADLRGVVEESSFRGGSFRIDVRLETGLIFAFPADLPQRGGERVGVRLGENAIVVYKEDPNGL
jgi:ABC-type Fe3+/spermidine/putrescine transport system ATPase subunit